MIFISIMLIFAFDYNYLIASDSYTNAFVDYQLSPTDLRYNGPKTLVLFYSHLMCRDILWNTTGPFWWRNSIADVDRLIAKTAWKKIYTWLWIQLVTADGQALSSDDQEYVSYLYYRVFSSTVFPWIILVDNLQQTRCISYRWHGHMFQCVSPPRQMATISQRLFVRCVFVNEKFCIWLEFVPEGPIDNSSAMV